MSTDTRSLLEVQLNQNTSVTVAELRRAALKSKVAGARLALENLLHDVLIDRIERAKNERPKA